MKTNKEKYDEMTNKGLIICSNWIRGCFNETIGYKKCLSCRIKERKNDKINRDNKMNNALIFNENNKNKKQCKICNDFESVETFNIKTNKCTICYKKSLVSNVIRNPRDKIKTRLYYIKASASKRNIDIELTDEQIIKLIQLNCNYCGENDIDTICGLDRVDNDKGYIKSNVVPSCEMCNMMKYTHSKEDFLQICEHIATKNKLYNGKTNYSLFTTQKTQTYHQYKYNAKKRKIDFEITTEIFDEIIKKKCSYCHIKNASGIDRIDSNGSYNIKNITPCCTTCNTMKLNYVKSDFLNQCYKITNYTNNSKILEDELIDFFVKYSKNENIVKRINPNFLHSKDYYEFRKWNGNLDDLKNVDIELEFVETIDQKDLWNYYRWTISSLNTFSPTNFFGRVICILVKDNKTDKYMGIISLSSDIYNMKERDLFIGWTNEQKKENLNLITNLSTCVSIQPFGFNYNGGKMLAMLAFSNEVMEKFKNKFKQDLHGIITTGLYGRSVQYDRLKNIKYIGMTKGYSVFNIPSEITDKCRKYLNNFHCINTSKYKKLSVLSSTIQLLGFDKNEILINTKKGIYFGFTRPDSKDFLCNKIDSVKNFSFKSAKDIFKEWYNRWAIQRYNHLQKNNSLIINTYKKSTERTNRFYLKLKKEMSDDEYKKYISDKNRKNYNKKKLKLIEV